MTRQPPDDFRPISFISLSMITGDGVDIVLTVGDATYLRRMALARACHEIVSGMGGDSKEDDSRKAVVRLYDIELIIWMFQRRRAEVVDMG